MMDDITELVRLLREKPDMTCLCAASCIERLREQRKEDARLYVKACGTIADLTARLAAAEAHCEEIENGVIVRVADLEQQLATTRALLKEACESISKAIIPMDNNVWYCFMPSILADDKWYKAAKGRRE